MEKKSSKQTLLLIVTIAVLVIAVVGVSFAFFTYSRQGTTNNYVTTGSINFTYGSEAHQITLDNEFPQAEGYAGANHEAFTFTVSGTIPTQASTVFYKVTAIEGDAVDEKTKFSSPAHLSILADVTKTGAGTATIQGSYATGAPLPSNMSSGVIIAKGSITNNNTAQSHNYSLKMWVNDSVTISDTNTATYRASSSATENTSKPIYSTLYYSLKVKVDARDTTAW